MDEITIPPGSKYDDFLLEAYETYLSLIHDGVPEKEASDTARNLADSWWEEYKKRHPFRFKVKTLLASLIGRG